MVTNLRRLFLQPKNTDGGEPNQVVAKEQPQSHQHVAPGQSTSQTRRSVAPSTSTSQNPEIAEFENRFRAALEKQGGVGGNFFLLLLESCSSTPGRSDYNLVFRTMQRMNPAVTKASILNSINACLEMIASDRDSQEREGQHQIKNLEAQQQSEQSDLEAKSRELQARIDEIKQELVSRNRELADVQSGLQELDGKYASQISKINNQFAVFSQVAQSFLDDLKEFGQGIQTNLD